MKNQETQVETKIVQKKIANVAKTGVYGDDVEKVEKVHDKYLQSQLALAEDLR